MRHLFFIISCLFISLVSAQNYTARDLKVTPLVEGTLLTPSEKETPPLAIIIGGSGPTDRDGNQMMMKNNALKLLAQSLSNDGIATFRYDKRIVKMMQDRTNFSEKDFKFDDFIEDATAVIDYFSKSNDFSNIYVIGHSQGSLVGMAAISTRDDVAGFISIAGPGQSIDKVIIDQLGNQAPGLKENAIQAFNDIRLTGKSENYSPGLASIFRADIQPFIASWMQFDPQELISGLEIPVFIINGTQDIQVDEAEAKMLQNANKDAQMLLIENMNHIFRIITEPGMDNQKSYNEPSRPIAPQLPTSISSFITKM
ncbi:alpha/beta hydrolase fold protein [unidentified eubacterium SCB49]|nr:alpha/beta hydrolase fold protein [unidentified eubacterium SCB49]